MDSTNSRSSLTVDESFSAASLIASLTRLATKSTEDESPRASKGRAADDAVTLIVGSDADTLGPGDRLLERVFTLGTEDDESTRLLSASTAAPRSTD